MDNDTQNNNNPQITPDIISRASENAVDKFVEKAKLAAQEKAMKEAEEQEAQETAMLEKYYKELASGDDSYFLEAMEADKDLGALIEEKGDLFRNPNIALGLSNLDSTMHPLLIKEVLNDPNKIKQLEQFTKGNLQVNQSKASRYLSKLAHDIFNRRNDNNQQEQQMVSAKPNTQAKTPDNAVDSAYNNIENFMNKYT